MEQHTSPASRSASRIRPELLAGWAEARLHESVGFGVSIAYLYGLELIDPEALDDPHGRAARLSFLAEDVDADELALGRHAARACQFDAALLAMTRWHTADAGQILRPGEHALRRRARVTVVVCSDGAATAARFEHAPDSAVVVAGLSIGGMAGMRLAAVWSHHRRIT